MNMMKRRGVAEFDNMPNTGAKVSDLDLGLMIQYQEHVSGMAESSTGARLAEDLQLIDSSGYGCPRNVGLLFFNHHPEDFFREAKIEIVYKPDETGHGMVEHTITGPLDLQLRSAIAIIRNMYIEEYVSKMVDRIEADRHFNYPLEIVEAALSNAVCYKSYDICEPITVHIHRDRMEITSIPGPDQSIADEYVEVGILSSGTSRNRRIRSFMENLGLIEHQCIGIPITNENLRKNGSGSPKIVTDAERSFITVVIPAFMPNSAELQPVDKVSPGRRSSEDIAKQVVEILRERGDMSVREISDAMGYKAPPSSLRKMISILMAAGTLEYTEPESIRSPTQRIRLVSH